MLPRNAYQQAPVPTARIDLILEIYERLLARLERAQGLAATNPEEAWRLINECRTAVVGVAAGLDFSQGEGALNFFRLYEFVAHELSAGRITEPIRVLQTLRDGFLAVRPQALEMERQGQLAPLESGRLRLRG